MYIKLGILYATLDGSFSRDKSRALIFLSDVEIMNYLAQHNLMTEFATVELMHVSC